MKALKHSRSIEHRVLRNKPMHKLFFSNVRKIKESDDMFDKKFNKLIEELIHEPSNTINPDEYKWNIKDVTNDLRSH